MVLLSGCSAADVLNVFVPREGYAIERDLAFGGGPRRRLDIYRPDDAPPDAPVLVFFYGGGWKSGARADYRFVGHAFAAAGFVTVIPDYRVYPEVRYPAFIEDGAAAVAWVAERKPERAPLYLAGHSAGAYIAAMLTLDERWLAGAGVRVCDTVTAAVGLAGPYDFLPLQSDDLKAIFGPEATRPRTQPINYVDGVAPPMLLISGRDDTTVLPRNSRRLAQRIRAKGGRVEERYYDDVGHVTLAASLSVPLRGLSPAFEDTVDYLRRHRRTERTCVKGAGADAG